MVEEQGACSYSSTYKGTPCDRVTEMDKVENNHGLVKISIVLSHTQNYNSNMVQDWKNVDRNSRGHFASQFGISSPSRPGEVSKDKVLLAWREMRCSCYQRNLRYLHLPCRFVGTELASAEQNQHVGAVGKPECSTAIQYNPHSWQH